MASEAGGPAIFLSYAHADRAKAQRLASILEQAGYTVWWDALVEGGSRFAKSIDEALDKADGLGVLWSKHWVESDWVGEEAAQGRDRQRLVPLALEGTVPALGFRQIQVIKLSSWHGRADAPQIDAIRGVIAASLGEQPGPRPVAGRSIDRRQALVTGGGAAVAVAGGGLIAWQTGLIGPVRANARSIAVLPFKNLGGDSAQAFISDGLTEEIRSALSRNSRLLVLATTSSNTVRDDQGDARSIAAKLDVAYLLDGSVQRAGDRVRVAINLTNGRTGFSEWSDRVDRQLGDIFAFQSEIARNVSNALSVRMATDIPAPGGTRNAKAFEAYLRGKALYNATGGEESDRAARANFELAIAADQNFALAHAALSRVLASIAASSAEASELKPLYNQAGGEAERAIELAPTLPQGQLALGHAKISNANATIGDSLMELGKLADARAAYLKEPSAMFRLRGLAVLEHRAGHQAAAEKAFARLVSEAGDAAMYQQAEVMAQWGQTDEAIAKLQRARAIGDSGLSLAATDPLLDPISKDPRFVSFVKDLGFG